VIYSQDLRVYGLVEMVVFALAVFVSFLYLISNGALDWGPVRHVRPLSETHERTTTSTVRRVSKTPAGPSADAA
jgi:NADH-quinone oxidoreductase subunit A